MNGSKDESVSRIKAAAMDARSNDDLVSDGFEQDLESPLDKETLDERHSTQMGDMWESNRRDADE